MSMIGLFTSAPQTAGAKASTGTASTAAGFGSTLQGALDALAKGAVETPTGDSAAAELLTPPVDTPEGDVPPVVAPVLGELVEAPAGDEVQASVAPLVEASEPPADSSSPTSTSSMGGSIPVSAPLLVELVETPEGDPAPPSTAVPAGAATSGVETLETSSVDEPAASPLRQAQGAASQAGGVPAAATPLAPLVETPPGRQQPTPTRTATAIASAPVPLPPVAPGMSNPVPVAPNSASAAAAFAPAPSLATPPTGNSAPVATSPANGVAVPVPSPSGGDPTPLQVPTAGAAPTVTAIQSAGASAPAAAPAPPQPVPFASQLARPIFSLAAAGAGEHVMTVSVTPDNLGPVTVRAHVSAEGVRVELFAPNDLGRDAIRAIIPDLRRDFAGAGLGSNLSLSSQNQPSSDGSASGSTAGQSGERDLPRGTAARASAAGDGTPAASEPEVDRSGRFGTISTIDVLA